MFTIHICQNCGFNHQDKVKKCRRCDCSKIKKNKITAENFCEIFGHREEETLVPRSQLCHGYDMEQGPIGKEIYSYEYDYVCLRCGHKKRIRR